MKIERNSYKNWLRPKKEPILSYMATASWITMLHRGQDFMDYKPVKKYTHAALRETLQEQIHFNKLKLLSAQRRNKIIKDVYRKTGVSIRQLGKTHETSPRLYGSLLF